VNRLTALTLLAAPCVLQPLVYAALDRNVKDQYVSLFGHKYARTLMQASAGCLMGIGEVALLPLDVLKIKAQTNPEAIGKRGLVAILREEKVPPTPFSLSLSLSLPQPSTAPHRL
jgi:hypothetical protein